MSSNVASRNDRQTVDEMVKHDRESSPKLRLLNETCLEINSSFSQYKLSNDESFYCFFFIFLLPCVIYEVLFESCLESSVCV